MAGHLCSVEKLFLLRAGEAFRMVSKEGPWLDFPSKVTPLLAVHKIPVNKTYWPLLSAR